MTAKFFKRSLAVAFMFAGFAMQATHAMAQTVNSVEDGLKQLAQTIVEKSTAAELTRIAVLPFPNADGSCSVLSTYLVDELILSLFSLPKSRIEIVERSQLEALLAEMQMGEGGLLNPATTKQLGNLSGVGALTLGTITIIGDAIRVNARLVATETGRTISAAAITVPKTQALDALLKQPVTTGPTCGKRSAEKQSGGGDSTLVVPAGTAIEQGGLQFSVMNAARSQDKSAVTLTIGIRNTRKNGIRLVWVRPVPAISDREGNIMYLAEVTGQDSCSDGAWFGPSPETCWMRFSSSYSLVDTDRSSFASLFFRQWKNGNGSKTIEGDSFTFAGTVQIVDSDPDDSSEVKTANISITIPTVNLAKTE